MNITEKLRIMLPHWLEHNQSHADEFAGWVREVEAENRDIARALDQAVQALQAAQRSLESALDLAGGPADDGEKSHGHHHHHHH